MSEALETIVSDRLELRPLTPEDANEMVAVLADERLHVFIDGRRPKLWRRTQPTRNPDRPASADESR